MVTVVNDAELNGPDNCRPSSRVQFRANASKAAPSTPTPHIRDSVFRLVQRSARATTVAGVNVWRWMYNLRISSCAARSDSICRLSSFIGHSYNEIRRTSVTFGVALSRFITDRTMLFSFKHPVYS
jgi:hypothetical protein